MARLAANGAVIDAIANADTEPLSRLGGAGYLQGAAKDFKANPVSSSSRLGGKGFLYGEFQDGGLAAETDPSFSSVSALLHFNGNFTDVKGNTWTGVGNAAATATGKFGNALILGPIGDYVRGTDGAAFDLATGKWTIEFWAKDVGTSAGAVYQFADGAWGAMIGYPVAGDLTFYASSAAAGWDIASAVSMGATPGSTFTHFAVVRDGNTFTTYRAGSRVSTFESAANIYMPTGAPTIGAYRATDGSGPTTNSMTIDDLRVTKGVARYSGATYTVPTAAFPDS